MLHRNLHILKGILYPCWNIFNGPQIRKKKKNKSKPTLKAFIVQSPDLLGAAVFAKAPRGRDLRKSVLRSDSETPLAQGLGGGAALRHTVFIFQGYISIFGKGSKRKYFQGRICEGISYGDLCPAYDSQRGFGEMCVRRGKDLFYSSLKLLEQNSALLVTSFDKT